METNDVALISQVSVNQILAARSARPKSLISANGNLMFFRCAWNRTTDSISGLEREATRMVRSPKAEMLFQISLNYFVLNRFC